MARSLLLIPLLALAVVRHAQAACPFEEIVLSGFVLDGKVHEVTAGDAMLTRPGSTHAIEQVGDEDLVLLIAYPTSTPEARTSSSHK